jgi:flagellar biosynthesis protein FlhG
VLTSGKGGVGTSNLALNLAIALGERGGRVVLVDADLGLANIDLLCGLAPGCDLGDILADDRPLAEAIVDGPAGIRIIPGAHASRTLIDALGDAPGRLVEELSGLEAAADFLVVDAGSGLGASIATLAAAADEVLVVTTPEPTSVADAHAAINRFRRLASPPTLRAVVNQVTSGSEADEVLARLTASSRQFFGAVVDGLPGRRRLARRPPPGPPAGRARARPRPGEVQTPRLLRRPGRPLGPRTGRAMTAPYPRSRIGDFEFEISGF